MAQGPITYGLPGVPVPAVTQAHPVGEPGAVKSEFAVMVMAACCPLPALAATGMLTATAKASTARKIRRRIEHPFPAAGHQQQDERGKTITVASGARLARSLVPSACLSRLGLSSPFWGDFPPKIASIPAAGRDHSA